jgi:pilus assembly protein CpaC
MASLLDSPRPPQRHPRARLLGGRWAAAGLFTVGLSGLSLAAWMGASAGAAGSTLVPSEPVEAPVSPEPARRATVSPGSAILQGEPRKVPEHTHLRLSFEKDVERIASGAPSILEHVSTLSTREVLMLGVAPGHTSVLVWYTDGDIEQLDVTVTQDLALLEAVLSDIHPGIEVQKAPDREALVLTGTVPKAVYARRAEDVARAWLGASDATGDLLVGDAARSVEDAQSSAGVEDRKRARRSTAAVLNLIRIEGLPEFGQLSSAEDQLLVAIASVGGAEVTVRRIQKGQVPDDSVDVLVLEGQVADQVALSRVLSLAYKVYVGNVKGEDVTLTDGVTGTTRVFEGGDLAIGDDIKVIADEAGALFSTQVEDNSTGNLMRGFGRTDGSSGNSGVQRSQLENRVGSNIARASALELAGGRILSFIEVVDLPQVRVDIRLYEVNRTKLLGYESDLGVINSDFNQGGLEPAAAAVTLQGNSAARVGSGGGADLQNVFGFLGGTASNQLQISGSNYAIDWAFSMLESEGIARSLANPTLSVLSGEVALFEVGGRIPIDQSFGTQVGIQGVFNTTRFVEFGVNLAVRPLVGKDDFITIDFAPEVSTPDALLTQLLVESTGRNQSTFAFESRLLKTSSRLLDGQTLLVGGLSQSSRSDEDKKTPWLSDLPLVGLLFQGLTYTDDDLQVVVMIRPTIVRDPLPNAAMWSYPTFGELMEQVLPVRPEPQAVDETTEAVEDEATAPVPADAATEGGAL